MSVYNYSNSNGKTSFNISFRSANTDTFTGLVYNARYFVNLRGIIDTDDFSKSYKVYFSMNMFSNGGTSIRSQIMTAKLQIGTNPINALIAGREAITSGIFMLFQNYYNTNTPTLIPSLHCRFIDNPPLILKNLYNTDYVNIVIQNTFNNHVQTFRYGFILHFEEIVD